MTTTGWVGVLVAILVIAGGAWFVMQKQSAPQTPQDNTGASVPTNSGQEGAPAAGPTDSTSVGVGAGATVSTLPTSATVTFSDSGFSPKSVTIGKGGTVTFVNNSSRSMWVASNVHPTHSEYDGTTRTAHCATLPSASFDQCQNAGSYSYTFGKTGSFDYHNHSAAQFGGVVVVQ